ncbi:MAG: hypothetical protein WBD02_00600 [Acidimicrobiia bacterium]
MALDELELELRRLPGVRAVGFSSADDFLMVQVHVSDETSTTTTTAFETARIARRHSILPVSVEIVRWKSPQHVNTVASPTVAAAAPASVTDSSSGGTVRTPIEDEVIDLVSEDHRHSPIVNDLHFGQVHLDPENDRVIEVDEPVIEAHEEIAEIPVEDAPMAVEPEPALPPRISPITSVINSFTSPVRRDVPPVTDESADAMIVEADAQAATDDFEEELRSDTAIDLTMNPALDERVRLLAVLPFPDTDEIEVHLTAGGRRSVGRAPASHGLSGAATATLDALRGFIPEHTYSVSFAHRLPEASDQFLVVAGIIEPDATIAPSQRFGVAASSSPSEAAARATLHALNRTLGIAKSRVDA